MRTVAAVLLLAMQTAVPFAPARRVSGGAPQLPAPTVVGWVQEAVEITVDALGGVSASKPLGGAGSQNLLAPAAMTWRFRPATDDGRPGISHVLAVALIRPPQLFDGPTFGPPPGSVAPESDDVPVPIGVPVPQYPANAIGDSVVLVELLVGTAGNIRSATVVQGSGFTAEALRAARQWRFRPAQRAGVPVDAYVYVAFGFRQPVSK